MCIISVFRDGGGLEADTYRTVIVRGVYFSFISHKTAIQSTKTVNVGMD